MHRSSGSPCPTFQVPTARCCSMRRCRTSRASRRPFSGWPACEPPMSSGVEIRAPAEQTEGTRSQVLRWLKQVGDSVAENEPLIEIETDKVTVEVASPATGVLREIIKHEQEEIAPGELLGRIDAGTAAALAQAPRAAVAQPAAGASPIAVPSATRAPAAAGGLSPAVRRLLSERGLDPSAVRGTGAAGAGPPRGGGRGGAGGG